MEVVFSLGLVVLFPRQIPGTQWKLINELINSDVGFSLEGINHAHMVDA